MFVSKIATRLSGTSSSKWTIDFPITSSDEEHDDKFQKNGVSWCPLSPKPMDYESSGDEEQDERFQKNGVSRCPLSPNPMDYESSSDEA